MLLMSGRGLVDHFLQLADDLGQQLLLCLSFKPGLLRTPSKSAIDSRILFVLTLVVPDETRFEAPAGPW